MKTIVVDVNSKLGKALEAAEWPTRAHLTHKPGAEPEEIAIRYIKVVSVETCSGLDDLILPKKES